MGLGRFVKAQRTKVRFWNRDRRWLRSERRKEIEAEGDLPPRPLTLEESELLRWILEHGKDESRSFLSQIEGAQAVRSCSCGCPSIRLYVPELAPLGSSGCDRIIGDLVGKTSKGELVGVLLFQAAGRLCELELYSLDGEANEFGLPRPETLTLFKVGDPYSPATP